jgi:hypothetical protein
MASGHPGAGVVRLAERLRKLREGAPILLTQSELGQALGGERGAVGPAAISSWENPASGRIIPALRLDAYARLFCTPRSFETAGAAHSKGHLLADPDLSGDERAAMERLHEELTGLRDAAVADQEGTPREAQSMWHFPDGSRITLVCSRLPPGDQPPNAKPGTLQYVRYSSLADLDALIDIYGAVRAFNPTSRVVIAAAQDLTQRDVANHLVLIGGLAWETVNPSFKRIFPIPVLAGDPADRGAIGVNDPADGTVREFPYLLEGGTLVEDVGYFARGENPSAPRRTLTICGGITTRGVRGAARAFIDYEMRQLNEQYLFPRFPTGSTYCVVMRVPVVNDDPITPDLSKKENRLFEWSDRSAESE